MKNQVSEAIRRMDISAFDTMMAGMSAPNVVNLGGGSLHGSLLPMKEIRSILEEEAQPALFQYGAARGSEEMMEAQQKYLQEFRNLSSKQEELLIVNGGTQGIDLACQAILDPGDTVLVEQPTFLIIYSILEKLKVNCVGVKMDREGIDPNDFEEKASRYHPKMLYCIPTFQNPSGITMPIKRRKDIYDIARRNAMMIIEDDPYYDLSFGDCRLPTIKSMDTEGLVILLGSYSKIIAPGLRVGFAVGAPDCIHAMLTLKQSCDMHTSYLNQHICAQMTQSGDLRTHVDRLSAQLAARASIMDRAVRHHFPAGSSWTSARGGIFLWVQLPEDVTMPPNQIITVGERKIAYMPGDGFFQKGNNPKRCMRLNFAAVHEKDIEGAILDLGTTFLRAVQR